MVQTAATARSFVTDPAKGPDVNSDFIGVGAANILAGFVGAFPVDASPPRTAVVAETGGRIAAGRAGLRRADGVPGALRRRRCSRMCRMPRLRACCCSWRSASCACRAMIDVLKRSAPEFALIVATMLAIVVLPIQQGVGMGIMLSILHGVWTTTRASAIEFERIPGTSIWWPEGALENGERLDGRARDRIAGASFVSQRLSIPAILAGRGAFAARGWS